MITHKIRVDLQNKGQPPVLYAVQGDTNSRRVEISLSIGNTPFAIPNNAVFIVRYGQHGGQKGVYDTLPSGDTAVSVDGSVVTATMAPQVFSRPGDVFVQIGIDTGESSVFSFSFVFRVEEDPSAGIEMPDEYVNLAGAISGAVEDWLDDHPEATTTVQDGSIGEEKLTAALLQKIEAGGSGGGLNATARALLITILRNGVYTADQSTNITALEAALAEGGSDEPVVPDEPENPEVTLTSISATYSGGDVEVGTAVADLTGIVVTAHYSDGSTQTVTGYTLSGTIAEGNNIVTVSYGGKTTTFTVTGVAEAPAKEYGLHHGAGYTGKLITPLSTTASKRWNIDKIVLDIDFITTTLPVETYVLLFYQYTFLLEITSAGEWTFNRSAEKVTADKTSAEVMGNGRTVVTFDITFEGETNAQSWVILFGSRAPEITWYGAKFYSGDTLQADLKPTANVGEMYDSVSGTTCMFDVTDGLTLVEV